MISAAQSSGSIHRRSSKKNPNSENKTLEASNGNEAKKQAPTQANNTTKISLSWQS